MNGPGIITQQMKSSRLVHGHPFSRFQVTIMYVLGTLLLLGFWAAVSMSVATNADGKDTFVKSPENGLMVNEETIIQEENNMPQDATDAHVSTNVHTSLNMNDTYTTVTVNGETTTIPSGQPYQQTYSTSSNGTQTKVDISADSTTSQGTASNSSTQRMDIQVNSETNARTEDARTHRQ